MPPHKAKPPLAAGAPEVLSGSDTAASSTPTSPKIQAPDAVTAFKAQGEARALLYHAGELTLHEAVDGLQHAAEENGLVRMTGQDAVQRLMSDAFAVVRREPPP